MSVATRVAIAVASVLVALPESATRADFGGTLEPGAGTVTVEASTGAVYGVGGRGGGAPRCAWDVVRIEHESSESGPDVITISPEASGDEYRRRVDGVLQHLYRVVCDDGTTSMRWVPAEVTAADLIPGVVDQASALLPLPELDVSPDPGVGGIVNVGLWLAVEPQVMPSVSAAAGPNAWISVAPRLVETRYDFGNGDVRVCDGTGVPIEEVHPDLDVQEESPTCGYTYRRSSPDGEPYRLTVTTVWELPYSSSAGGGVLPALERSATVDYDVDEVQTVGLSN